MESETDINSPRMEDNDMNVDNDDFSPNPSSSTSFLLRNAFNDERTNYSLRSEVPCSTLSNENRCLLGMKICDHNSCKCNKNEEAQEVPECDVSSDEDDQRMLRIQHLGSNYGSILENSNDNKRRKFESKYFITTGLLLYIVGKEKMKL